MDQMVHVFLIESSSMDQTVEFEKLSRTLSLLLFAFGIKSHIWIFWAPIFEEVHFQNVIADGSS